MILTPHVGGSTEEAQEDIGRFVGGKLRDYVHSGSTSLSVNLPTPDPGPLGRTRQRIAHIHQNTPGVLAHVNQVLAEHEVNIGGQVLATRGTRLRRHRHRLEAVRGRDRGPGHHLGDHPAARPGVTRLRA